MDNILEMNHFFALKRYVAMHDSKTDEYVYLYYDCRDIVAKDINLPFKYEGNRHVGGGDYVNKVIYTFSNFDTYNHYRFTNKNKCIGLQIDGPIANKIFECETILVEPCDNNNKTIFENCKFICDKLYLAAKMNYVTLTNCDFSEVKTILI
jgi:hypothetical protein